MKPSLCSIGDRETGIVTFIERMAEFGYEGIELHEEHIRGYLESGESPGSLAKLIESRGLKASAISSYATFLGKRGEFERSLSRFRDRVLPWSVDLGRAPIRVLLDWIGSAQVSAEERSRIVQGLTSLAREAETECVDLLLETHGDQLTDTTDATLRLLDETGMDNVKVNLDIYNLRDAGEDPIEALDRLFPYVANVHLKNGTRRGTQVVYGKRLIEGDMDFEPFLKELRAKGYSGYLGIEWFGEGFWEAAREESVWLRNWLAETR